MAKKQRGETVVSAENMEEHAENFSLLLNSSDDEAPEEVTFEESKSEALRSINEVLHTARREKEALREKRRRRHELFQEQKKRHLLPDDVLEEMGSAAWSRRKRPEDPAEDEDGERREKRQKKLPDSRNFKGSYTVTTVKEGTSVSVQQQAAEDFIKSRLYGPGSCRTTNNELLSLQNKKCLNKSPAVQFVRKDWASKERVKAEKLKKRWLHKQQNQTC
ncbi:nucleolar protein 7 [Solea senegalensis]|uniref:Nucleolar protein 7 n=2 Tax=Solea senegalensis TaxID=28829 RepID=A0AAV6T4S0_SOLSE|nr:nucleolar protein 7 [Solea senegalensis]